MKHRSWIGKKTLAVLFAAMFFAVGLAQAEEKPGAVRGAVVTLDLDGARSAIPAVAVTIENTELFRKTTTDEQGSFNFRDLPPGRYRIRASAPGLSGSAPAEVRSGQSVDVQVVVEIEALKESITVNGNAEQSIATEPEQQTEIKRPAILNAPNKDDRADTLLPLIPGVVRGPDGLINMKGARSSQSGSLVNSTSVVDPVTGNQAMSLPIDVVESATVISNPYDPEYGRLAGAVSRIETTTSKFDGFHFSVQNLVPRPRRRDDDLIGIEAATPRATFTGPLIKNKVAFTESFEYRFLRTPVDSLPPLERDMKFEGMTWFTQADVNLTSRQTMTATFTIYPQS